MAIDEYNDSQFDQAGAARWNGRRWAALGDTGTATLQDDQLSGISCIGNKSCMAVGYFTNYSGHNQTLTETWNGSKWKRVSSPDANRTGDNQLSWISCVSEKFCVAAGYYTTAGGHDRTLTEVWIGSRWKLVGSPDGSGSGDNQLLGISCVSQKSCLAVGYYASSSGSEQTLTEEWNGSRWKQVGSPSPGGSADNNQLASVSCTSTSFCMATGISADLSTGMQLNLAERWNGRHWQRVTIASPGTQFNQLNSISCSGAGFCVTVGWAGSDTPPEVVAERWNGRVWAAEATKGSRSQSSTLTGVSCATPRFCAGVGSSDDGTFDRSLAERWNSSNRPTLTSFPDYTGAAGNQLNGVSCTDADFCMGVGNHGAIGTDVVDNAAERWNGSRWQPLAVPDVSQVGSSPIDNLSAVSCTSPRFCMAVGSFGASLLQNLADRWNGRSWSNLAVPDTSSTQVNQLTSVSCASSTFCVAAGYSSSGGEDYQALMLRWNGVSWSPMTAADPGGIFNQVQAVSCTSDVFCLAVGQYGGSVERTLAEKWNGSTWTQAGAASPGTDGNQLYSLSCRTARLCMAVGTDNFGRDDQVLMEEWNGSSFRRVVAPSPRTQSLMLGVSCASGRFCAAIGSYGTPNISQSLTELWNGRSWLRVSSPDTSSSEDQNLASVSCVSSAFCLAAGNYSGPVGGIAQNLTLKWAK